MEDVFSVLSESMIASCILRNDILSVDEIRKIATKYLEIESGKDIR